MNLPATETLENPPPRPVAFHSRGGPPAGHSLARPVSGEIPSRLGPRNWPQSGTPAPASFFEAWPNVSDVAVVTVTRNSARPKFFASFTVEISKNGSLADVLIPYLYTPETGPSRIPGRETADRSPEYPESREAA